MYEIIFNGKGSYTDLGVLLSDFTIQPPAPKIIKQDVPFMNGVYDFSTVATNGNMVYGQRKGSCVLDFFSDNKALMYVQYSKVLEWLLCGKKELIYTGEPDMKYYAQIEDAPSFDEFVANNGSLNITFIADPFKQGVNEVGNEAWDTFNFEIDYMQNVEFDVVNSATVEIYNPGRPMSPVINCDNSMTATSSDGYTVFLVEGDNNDWSFKLQTGLNSIDVVGTGHIKFIFRKEML